MLRKRQSERETDRGGGGGSLPALLVVPLYIPMTIVIHLRPTPSQQQQANSGKRDRRTEQGTKPRTKNGLWAVLRDWKGGVKRKEGKMREKSLKCQRTQASASSPDGSNRRISDRAERRKKLCVNSSFFNSLAVKSGRRSRSVYAAKKASSHLCFLFWYFFRCQVLAHEPQCARRLFSVS